MEKEKERIISELRSKGYSNPTSIFWGCELYDELYGKGKDVYDKYDIEWANERGFSGEEKKIFDLTESNYKDYLSRKDYHILDPIDPLTKRLVDGKLVIYYTIGGRYPQYVPDYYCWIDDYRQVIPMEGNVVKHYSGLEDYLKKLLDKVGTVAIKPLAGYGGIGFVKLEVRNGAYFANNELVKDFSTLTSLINKRHVVTEFIQNCKEFDEVWKDSTATLRVVSINTSSGPNTFISYVRFGTKISKGACNLCAGGIGVPFDWQTGEYFGKAYRYFTFCDDGNYTLDCHPESGYIFKGKKLPHIDEVKQLVNDICKYLCVHSYFGFDIMISDDKVKICEINTHPTLDYEQLMFGGVWKQSEEVQRFFREKLAEKDVEPVLTIK